MTGPSVRFSDIRHLADLAKILGTTAADLETFSTTDLSGLYTSIKIPKRGRKRRGEFRVVYKAQQALALVLKNLADAIARSVVFDDCVQGFVYKRSIGSNARVHLGQRVLLHADIHHFFESITVTQVETAFASIGCSPPIAAALAHVSTLNGHLPEGSSSSPVIANLVGRYLDADMKTLAAAHGCRYTRYADDMTVSGDEVPAEARVAAILEKHGFQLRDGQCRTQHRGRSQFVTGLSVSDPERPHVARRAKRRLRLELYYAAKFGLQNHLDRTRPESFATWELKRLGGWVTFLYSIEGPKPTHWYFQKWKVVRDRAGEPEPPYNPPPDEPGEDEH